MSFRQLSHKILFSIIFLKCLSIIDCKPKLSVISKQTSVVGNKSVIDINTNTTLRLKCEGKQAMFWSFPENDPYSLPIKNLAKINSKCLRSRKCFSEMTLHSIQYFHTGQYSCKYNKSHNEFDAIYVFVNDPDKLIVPVEGNDEFLVVSVLEKSTNFLIPCKPTDSRAVASLHVYDINTERFVQLPEELVSFDPTVGFNVSKINSQQYEDIDCRVKSVKNEQYITITIHNIRLSQTRLYPTINVVPNNTRVGDNITMICHVNIAANTFIDITWHFNTDPRRKSEGLPESVIKQSSEGVFETVSRSLTIFNPTDIDSGVYSCNVTDLSEHTYSVSKNLIISESSMDNYSSADYSMKNEKFLLILFLQLVSISSYFPQEL